MIRLISKKGKNKKKKKREDKLGRIELEKEIEID